MAQQQYYMSTAVRVKKTVYVRVPAKLAAKFTFKGGDSVLIIHEGNTLTLRKVSWQELQQMMGKGQ